MVPQSVAEQVVTALQGMTTGYVMRAATELTRDIQPIIVLGLTILIIFKGWSIASGRSSETLSDFLFFAFKVAFVTAISFSMAAYIFYVSDTVFAFRNWLVASFSEGARIDQVLDRLWTPVRNYATQKLSIGWLDIFTLNHAVSAGFFTLFAAALLMAFALGYWALCHVALTLLMAVGPIFVLFAIFPATQKFTESWLSQTFNYVLLSGLSFAATAMAVDFAQTHITQILENENANTVLAVAGFNISIYALVALLWNLNNIATALTGGIGLQGASRILASLLTRQLFSSSGSSAGAGGSIRAIPSSPTASGGTLSSGGTASGGVIAAPRGGAHQGTSGYGSQQYIYQRVRQLGRNRG